jgi:hypothetical protein
MGFSDHLPLVSLMRALRLFNAVSGRVSDVWHLRQVQTGAQSVGRCDRWRQRQSRGEGRRRVGDGFGDASDELVVAGFGGVLCRL